MAEAVPPTPVEIPKAAPEVGDEEAVSIGAPSPESDAKDTTVVDKIVGDENQAPVVTEPQANDKPSKQDDAIEADTPTDPPAEDAPTPEAAAEESRSDAISNAKAVEPVEATEQTTVQPVAESDTVAAATDAVETIIPPGQAMEAPVVEPQVAAAAEAPQVVDTEAPALETPKAAESKTEEAVAAEAPQVVDTEAPALETPKGAESKTEEAVATVHEDDNSVTADKTPKTPPSTPKMTLVIPGGDKSGAEVVSPVKSEPPIAATKKLAIPATFGGEKEVEGVEEQLASAKKTEQSLAPPKKLAIPSTFGGEKAVDVDEQLLTPKKTVQPAAPPKRVAIPSTFAGEKDIDEETKTEPPPAPPKKLAIPSTFGGEKPVVFDGQLAPPKKTEQPMAPKKLAIPSTFGGEKPAELADEQLVPPKKTEQPAVSPKKLAIPSTFGGEKPVAVEEQLVPPKKTEQPTAPPKKLAIPSTFVGGSSHGKDPEAPKAVAEGTPLIQSMAPGKKLAIPGAFGGPKVELQNEAAAVTSPARQAMIPSKQKIPGVFGSTSSAEGAPKEAGDGSPKPKPKGKVSLPAAFTASKEPPKGQEEHSARSEDPATSEGTSPVKPPTARKVAIPGAFGGSNHATESTGIKLQEETLVSSPNKTEQPMQPPKKLVVPGAFGGATKTEEHSARSDDPVKVERASPMKSPTKQKLAIPGAFGGSKPETDAALANKESTAETAKAVEEAPRKPKGKLSLPAAFTASKEPPKKHTGPPIGW